MLKNTINSWLTPGIMNALPKSWLKDSRDSFDIKYQGPKDVQLTVPNLKLMVGDEIDLWNKIMKEVQMKRVAGPFEKVPYKNFIQSPVGLVPKDNGRNTRLIFHLSYPRTPADEAQTSVNGNTPQHLTKVNYPDFSLAVESVCVKVSVAIFPDRTCDLLSITWDSPRGHGHF